MAPEEIWLILLTPLGKLAPARPTPLPNGSFPLFIGDTVVHLRVGNLPDTIRKVRYPLTPVMPHIIRKIKRMAVPAPISLTDFRDEKI
jgi:hypothetical protein